MKNEESPIVDFTPALAADGAQRCLRNARRLLHDARLLYDNSRYPRALSLAILAMEEVAKIEMISRALCDPGYRTDFVRNFRSHKEKHITAIVHMLTVRYKTSGPDSIKQLLKGDENFLTFDQAKQKGFYVDIENGNFSSPDDVISKELAESTIRAVDEMVSRHENFFVQYPELSKLFEEIANSRIMDERQPDQDLIDLIQMLKSHYENGEKVIEI